MNTVSLFSLSNSTSKFSFSSLRAAKSLRSLWMLAALKGLGLVLIFLMSFDYILVFQFRYQGIRKERSTIIKANGGQLYCSLANDINSRITYSVKMVCLCCTVSFMFAGITQFRVNIAFSLLFLHAGFLTTLCYGAV